MNQRDIRKNCQKCGHMENRLLRGLTITTPWCRKTGTACDEIQVCPADARIPKTKPARRTVEGVVRLMRPKGTGPRRTRGRPKGSNRRLDDTLYNRIISLIQENMKPGEFEYGMNAYSISQELGENDMTIRNYLRDLVDGGKLESMKIGRIVLYRPVTKR
jgi:hypothetical protein